MQSDAGYVSYLLRLRQVYRNNGLAWVASVQSTATGDQRSFPSLAALITFLVAEFGERAARPSDAQDQGQDTP